MNPRREASERVNGAYEVRVLEPSPPPATDGPWFADDPAAPGESPAGKPIVSPVTTVAAAADVVGVDPGAPEEVYAPATTLDPDAPLVLDARSVEFLGAWFGFAASALEQLRAEADPVDEPSRVQLWPEHFDLSVDLGDEGAGRRGTFGASPGDDVDRDPYLYVTHWADVGEDDYWNEKHFPGASLTVVTLAAVPDQRASALTFLRRGRDLLRGP